MLWYDFLGTEAKGYSHSDLKQYATFHDPNMYPKIEFEVNMSYNIGEMILTRFLLAVGELSSKISCR